MDWLVVRERFIDDYLLKSLDGGLEQVVILGAGYDSRPYRFNLAKQGVKVFEIDHPATQKDKIARLRRILGELPAQVVFVPVDFNTQSLEQRLYESGYDPKAKTLFIWQGVVYYLQAEAVDNTLSFVAHHSAPGSSIIFDYGYTWLIEQTRRGEIRRMRRARRFTGEGLIFGIGEGTVEAFLQQRGFTRVQNTTTDDLRRLYLSGPNQGRRLASGYAIASASVLAGASVLAEATVST